MRVLLAVLLLAFQVYAVSICGDNGAVFDDDNLCNSMCSSCATATLLSTGATGTCDKANYQGFVYYNGKTYALSKSLGFWEDFTNLVVIPDQQTNDLLAEILSYYNLPAWIGLYDPNRSTDYNSTNPDRFVWINGSPVSYSNWASGEPNNYVFNEDIGIVPILGEHWAYMYTNGTWNDDGYHTSYGGDYKPRLNALVEWDGVLDCVNAYIPENIDQTINNLIDIVCNGTTPCYICGSGTQLYMCETGTSTDGQTSYVCPVDKTKCTATYTDPICPEGGTFNSATGLCEVEPSVAPPASSGYGGITGYIEISLDGRSVRINVSGQTSSWVDLSLGGEVSIITRGAFGLLFKNVLTVSNSGISYYADVGLPPNDIKPADLCSNSDMGYSYWYYSGYTWGDRIYISDNTMKLCTFSTWYGESCYSTITFDKNYVCNSLVCPDGYTYDSTTGKCIANPACSEGTYDTTVNRCYIGDLTCPLGSYDCISIDGERYCSATTCIDASAEGYYETSDSVEGANDKLPDGEIDEEGNCLGTLYIFNGEDKRCRPPGIQTYYTDCCTKDEIELLNLVTIGRCNESEQYLSSLRNWGDLDGRCHYVGEYCAQKLDLGFTEICLQEKKTFCCFSSPLARIVQEQGREQLGIDWGTPESPNCRGFTPTEFQKIDWNRIDFSEWIENEVIPNVEQNLQNNLQNTIENIKTNTINKY